MRRRDALLLIASAIGWPLTVRAAPAQPIIGFLSSRSADESQPLVAAFLDGLGAEGFVPGKNVVIDYRWARGPGTTNCQAWPPISSGKGLL